MGLGWVLTFSMASLSVIHLTNPASASGCWAKMGPENNNVVKPNKRYRFNISGKNSRVDVFKRVKNCCWHAWGKIIPIRTSALHFIPNIVPSNFDL